MASYLKRNLLLYLIWKYFDIKSGHLPKHPITVIFGGKAAPAYVAAQDIIHAILVLSSLIANDADVSPYLQVIMIENYNVTAAEHVIPAADISEQISLASKEASGTSNMKFMLNGAVTVCTVDGANVEIADLVGKENIYTFGASSDEVVSLYEHKGYKAKEFYKKPQIKPLVDFLISPEFISLGNEERLLVGVDGDELDAFDSGIDHAVDRVGSAAAAPYSDSMVEMLQGVAERVQPSENPLLEKHESVKRILAVAVVSDRGLAGGFNSNVLRAVAGCLGASKGAADGEAFAGQDAGPLVAEALVVAKHVATLARAWM